MRGEGMKSPQSLWILEFRRIAPSCRQQLPEKVL